MQGNTKETNTLSGVWEAGQACTKPVVKVNGQSIEVEPSQPFQSTVKQLAAARGLAKFTVKADGTEIKSHNIPQTFTGIKLVEIRKYDEAA